MPTPPDKTLFLETFGCQMNFLDSELVIGQFRRLGFRVIGDRDRADVILFNTCAVRDHAEQKVTSRLGELRAIKAQRPGVIIGVIGCQAEREGKLLIRRFPHVDLLCGPGQLHRLPALVESAQAGQAGHPVMALSGGRRGRRQDADPDGEAIEALDQSRAASFQAGDRPLQAFVRVQRGCDKFCAYCVVPAVRGAEKCRRPEHVLADARHLADAGCREITLLGQTVNNYRQNDATGQPVSLARLLEQVCRIDHLARVRFVTNYPGGFDEDILRAMRGNAKICPYLHIPAQSGSDRILRAMKRHYTAADYYRLIDRARELAPGLSLAGDFIVGFPGETEADFAETVEMVRRVGYKNCFVFKYSPRPGTAAHRHMPDDVPDDVKRERNNVLLAVQAEISGKANAQLVGQSVNVLVEGFSKQELDTAKTQAGKVQEVGTNATSQATQLAGRTAADQIVVFPCPAETDVGRLVGRLADVRIAQVTPYTLIGQIERIEGLGAESSEAADAPLPLRYKSRTALPG